ncbi:MAG: hypothetical protein Q8O13_08295 [Candidatus Omnitrophota bacterium]|nr:hypothetical protein [Candidatus Omnitrophota bacterium]
MVDKCIFCETQGIEGNHLGLKDSYMINCPLCMRYIVSSIALTGNVAQEIPKEDRILFSGHLRNNYIEHRPPEILSQTIMQIPDIVAPYKRLSPMDKVNKLILYIADSSKHLGDVVSLDLNKDYVLFFCKNTKELFEIREYLRETGIIKMRTENSGPILTIEGWKKSETLKEINKNSKAVFVAMCFDKDLKGIFDNAILPACQECGFEAFRVDSTEHNEKICDKIIADLKSSRFVIADFTRQRQGVYFEAGFARGLGLEVIWTCKKEEADSLNFDTRQYNHILWDGCEDLKGQLIDRIKATVK